MQQHSVMRTVMRNQMYHHEAHTKPTATGWLCLDYYKVSQKTQNICSESFQKITVCNLLVCNVTARGRTRNVYIGALPLWSNRKLVRWQGITTNQFKHLQQMTGNHNQSIQAPSTTCNAKYEHFYARKLFSIMAVNNVKCYWRTFKKSGHTAGICQVH